MDQFLHRQGGSCFETVRGTGKFVMSPLLDHDLSQILSSLAAGPGLYVRGHNSVGPSAGPCMKKSGETGTEGDMATLLSVLSHSLLKTMAD